ncbi:MAG TPA: ribonuclease P protein component [Firmicutes bacterium]|nr:ribonuclease P protein component [Bacillota bacterium]
MNPKIVTLKENRDFKRLYAKGKSCPHPLLVTYARKNRLNISRIGITTSKKIGNAVSRNRARRVIREAYRSMEPGLPGGWDFVFVARYKTTLIKTQQLIPVMRKQISKLTTTKTDGGVTK